MNPILTFIVVLLGIYGLCNSRNLIKSIICLNIVQTSVILLFLNFANFSGSGIPIITGNTGEMTDPLPQALMITAIVIGAAITALSLMICVKIFHYYGTLNWHELIRMED